MDALALAEVKGKHVKGKHYDTNFMRKYEKLLPNSSSKEEAYFER
jgi:hypothetical protein